MLDIYLYRTQIIHTSNYYVIWREIRRWKTFHTNRESKPVRQNDGTNTLPLSHQGINDRSDLDPINLHVHSHIF